MKPLKNVYSVLEIRTVMSLWCLFTKVNPFLGNQIDNCKVVSAQMTNGLSFLRTMCHEIINEMPWFYCFSANSVNHLICVLIRLVLDFEETLGNDLLLSEKSFAFVWDKKKTRVMVHFIPNSNKLLFLITELIIMHWKLCLITHFYMFNLEWNLSVQHIVRLIIRTPGLMASLPPPWMFWCS